MLSNKTRQKAAVTEVCRFHCLRHGDVISNMSDWNIFVKTF